MFRKSRAYTQPSLFSNIRFQFSDSVAKEIESPNKWYIQFHTQVTSQIDEDLFRPLFNSAHGSPNSPIRVLIAMMVLKEATGMSEVSFFEDCRMNMKFHYALGLLNFDDPIPTVATYHNLRRSMKKYEAETGIDLMEAVFQKITKSQILEFGISGSKVRIDTTLIGSNIKYLSRYELIHETLRVAYNKANKKTNILIDSILSDEEQQLLLELTKLSADNVTYSSSSEEIQARLQKLGNIIYKIIRHIPSTFSEYMQVLHSVFHQQYEVIEDEACLLPKEQLKASNIQSPHDTESHYHKKGESTVKGYTVGLFETCDPENGLNLLIGAKVEPASVSDVDFVKPALEMSQEILGQNIETLHSDGAFYSPENQDICEQNGTTHIFGRMAGYASSLDYAFDEDGNLVVTCLKTNQLIPAVRVNTKNPDAPPKWRIKTGKKPRYITEEDIKSNILRKSQANFPKSVLNIRNNVEASICHVKQPCSNDKTRFRGIYKHKLWTFARCLWVNFRRILKYLNKIKPKTAPLYPIIQQVNINEHYRLDIFSIFCILCIKTLNICRKMKLFLPQ